MSPMRMPAPFKPEDGQNLLTTPLETANKDSRLHYHSS